MSDNAMNTLMKILWTCQEKTELMKSDSLFKTQGKDKNKRDWKQNI